MPDLIPFHFGSHTVRVEIDEQGNPWWIAMDVCEVLALKNVSNAVGRLALGEKGIRLTDKQLIINESGLYRLIFRSDKPEAKAFQTWVFEEVLPSIRKTGKYDAASDGTTGDALVRMAEAYRDQEKRLIAMERQQQEEQRMLLQTQRDMLQTQQDMLALQQGVIEAKEASLLAFQSMQWVTIRQYVEMYGMHHQCSPSIQRSYATWLNTYCLERNFAMYKAATADKTWPYEKTYCIAVLQDTFPGWLRRYGGQDQQTLQTEES
jgi:prophage antirepressor-like protein